MRVYISGKIGEEVISDATRQKFARAEKKLKAIGYEVFNPTSEEWQECLSQNFDAAAPFAVMDKYTYILLKDMQKLAKCDAVYFLRDWDLSGGAMAENAFAKATGKKMLWQNEIDASLYLRHKWWDEFCDIFLNDDSKEGTCLDEVDKYIELHLKEIWIPLLGSNV